MASRTTLGRRLLALLDSRSRRQPITLSVAGTLGVSFLALLILVGACKPSSQQKESKPAEAFLEADEKLKAELRSAATDSVGAFEKISLEEALQRAGTEKKLVLVDFYTTWCPPCKLLDENTWPNPLVTKALKQYAVALKLDAEKVTALAAHYKVEAYPTLVFLDAEGTIKDRWVGFRPPEKFIEDFAALRSGKTSQEIARDAAKADETSKGIFDYGKALAREGKYDEGFAQMVLAYKQSISEPGLAGVRDSFWLSEMASLAQKHPPALEKMKAMRDELEKSALNSSDSRAFQSFIAFNNYLKDPDRTLAVLDKIPESTKSFAFHHLLEELVSKRNYELLLQHFTPEEEFQRSVSNIEDLERHYGDGSPSTRNMAVASLKKFAVQRGSLLVEALAGGGKPDRAKELIDKVLELESSVTAQDLLERRIKRSENREVLDYFQKKAASLP